MPALEEQLAAAELYGRQRDQAELQAERAIQIALYAKLAEYEIEWGGTLPSIVLSPVSFDDSLHIWIGSIALAAWNASRTRPEAPKTTSLDAFRVKRAWTDMLVAEKAGFVDKLVTARAQRIAEGFVLPPDQRPDIGSNSGWARSVARTEATRVASDALSEMAVVAMAEELGRPLTSKDEEQLWKIWITRGDAKVRELHRKLYGAPVRGAESPFWSWPTGQVLRYPGDPLAPYGTIVNCRCIHWVMPAATPEADLVDTFRPANLDTAFDVDTKPLAASALVHPHHPSVFGNEVGDASYEYDVVMQQIRHGVLTLEPQG